MVNVEDWYASNAIDISKAAISIAPAQVISHAWFNSETASVSISNKIEACCEKCEIQSKCSHLQKNRSLIALTGDGDGDYLVRALLSQTVPDNATYAADGALIILDREIESTTDGRYGKLRVTSPMLAPLHLGTMPVEAHTDSAGRSGCGFLFISDSEATVDSTYCIVDLPLVPGDYQVVVFMGEALYQSFSPRMIGIYGPNFSEALDETLHNLEVEMKDGLRVFVQSNEETTVQSRLVPNGDSLAILNSELFYDRSHLLSDSWAIQRFFEGSEYFRNRMEEFLPQSQYTVMDWIRTADALRIRGHKAHSNNVLTQLLGSGIHVTEDEEAYLLAVLRAKPGVWPA